MSVFDSLRGGIQGLANRFGFGGGGQQQGQTQPGAPGENPLFAEDYVKRVNDYFQEWRQNRIPLELQWRLNLEFLLGNQYQAINPFTQSLEETPLQYEWEEREVENQIAPIWEVRVARLGRGRLIRKVRPASSEQRDLASAEISAKILLWAEEEHDFREQLGEKIAWAEATGSCGAHNGWDPYKGNLLAQFQPVDEMTGEPSGDPEPLHEGDLDPQVIPPFELYPENLFQSYRRNNRLIWARAYPLDYIRDTYGVEVQEEACDSYTLQQANIGTTSATSQETGRFQLQVKKLRKHALVKHLFERPSRRYPEGQYIVVAGSTLLHAGPLPNSVGKGGKRDIPITMYYSLRVPGRFFGECLIPRLIPVQRKWNSLCNKKSEYLKRAAIGQPVMEDGALQNQAEIEQHAADPGQIWLVNAGRRYPEYMQFPALPADFDKEERRLLEAFRDLSGVSALSKMSEAPAGVKSGVALSIAVEQDETRLSTTAGFIEEGVIEEGRHQLRLYKQFAKTPRVARIASKSEVEIIEWTGSDIRSDDVILEGGSGLAESPAQRRQFIFDLLGSGVLYDPDTGRLSREGRAQVLELMEFGHWESASDSDYDLQVAKANRQVKTIKAGYLPNVAPFDDPEIHLRELHRWMLTSEFEEMSAQNQNVLVAAYTFEAALVQAYQVRLAQEMQQQAAMAGRGAETLPAAGGGRSSQVAPSSSAAGGYDPRYPGGKGQLVQ